METLSSEEEAGVRFLMEFFPAEWGGARGISEAEARAVIRGLLDAWHKMYEENAMECQRVNLLFQQQDMTASKAKLMDVIREE